MKQFVETINAGKTPAVVTLVDQEVEGIVECPACENIFTAEQKDAECPYCSCRFEAEVSPIYLVVASLKKSFSKETCCPDCREKWSEENSTIGHGTVTALVVQKYLGGEICKTHVNGAIHYFNILEGGRIIDAAADQFANFGVAVRYGNRKRQSREYILRDPDVFARYELLKQKFEKEYEEFKEKFV